MSKADTFADPVWANYPKLRHLAAHMLDDLEAENLLGVLLLTDAPDIQLEDSLDISHAMIWDATPQGDAYWRDIYERIIGLAMPEYDPTALPVAHGQTVGETKAGWQPDIVNGASVMDITRSLF